MRLLPVCFSLAIEQSYPNASSYELATVSVPLLALIIFMIDVYDVVAWPRAAAYKQHRHQQENPDYLHTVSIMQIMRQRPHLRVVIASATMDVQKFAIFFANSQQQLPPPPPHLAAAGAVLGVPGSVGVSKAPSRVPAILSVEGRLYPVQEHFLTVRSAAYSYDTVYATGMLAFYHVR